MDAIKLYRKYTKDALLSMQAKIADDPESRNTTPGSIYIYKATARKKLDAIATAITMHLADEREAAGQPVSQAGYSGRQTNRRR